MAKQQIVWTVLPYGRMEDGPLAGRLRVSVVVSPRLTPASASEQSLAAFPEWTAWPKMLNDVRLRLRIDGQLVELEPVSRPDPEIWTRLLPPETPVSGFEFTNMAKVNLRSFPVRHVLGLLRRHYGILAVQSTGSHPTLLPWRQAHPNLKDLLTELGTRTQTINLGDRQIELPLPGFDRFLDEGSREGHEDRLRDLVFGPRSRYRARATGIGLDSGGSPEPGGDFALRALPPDWSDPAAGGPGAAVMANFTSASEYTLYQANRFYRREPLTGAKRAQLEAEGQLRRPKLQGVADPPAPPEFDFHAIIGSYADYPELLRVLGLLIDCVLPADSPIDQLLQATPQAQGVMGLDLVWSGAHDPGEDACPGTAWCADKTRFTTRPRTSDHVPGLLNLAQADDRWHQAKDAVFDVYQVDADGAALKTVNFLLSAQNLVAKSLSLGSSGEVTYTTGDKQPVAALRSGGLGVSRHGRAVAIAQTAASAALKDQAIRSGPASAQRIVLFTEDVLRGYRVDALPMPAGTPDRWYSLCERRGTYRYAGTDDTIPLPPDEGYVKGASTTSTASPEVDPDDHYLHESLFRWTGWSLVAPRPGRTLRARVDPATNVQGEVPEDVTDEAAEGGSGLAVDFVARTGTLPRLRFGVPYRFRARVVDLAGNSLKHNDPSLEGDPNASQPVVYWRFEPVDPPALVHRTRVSEGESLERMVIRSNWNVSAPDYVATPAFAAARALPASADFDYPAENERHVVPPKSSQLQCEQHGAFDHLLSGPGNIKQAYAIAAREAGTLYDAGPTSDIELVTPGALQDVATTTAVPPQLPSAENPTGDRLAPGQYVIHREPLVTTPYLPDPAAGGIALRATPGHTLPGVTGPMALGPGAAVVMAPNQELVLLVAYAGSWPDTTGLRIVLAEREGLVADLPCEETYPNDGAPVWNHEERVLTFFVPKGRIVRLRYASFVHPGFIDTLGIPDWVSSAGEQQFVRVMAQLGCAWMVTPFRPLTLVHATQQPACQPELLGLTVHREPGDQHAMLGSRLRMHGPSTGKFEIEAAWEEWVDDPEKPRPELVDGRGQLGEILLAENHENLCGLEAAVAAQQPPAAGQGPTGQPRARGDRHEFGDTKFRLIRYTIRATTRFREYLPEALYEQIDEVTRVGPVAEGQAMSVGQPDDPGAPAIKVINGVAPNTIVPASAPPDEPRVMYVVPTFRWNDVAGTNTLDTTRLGNGLRVWLERPWFSSGNGELLGVVILGQDRPFTDIPSALVPFVTQWGLDPLWDTNLPRHRTRVSDFHAFATHEPVALQEAPSTIVHVVGHRVRWDDSRRLWYSDIELDLGMSYMPFVRLALVRYQPNAIDGAKVSKVVLSSFAQVLPRRRAVFQRAGSSVRLRLFGIVPQYGPMRFPIDSEYQDISFLPPLGQEGESGRNRVELVLQTRDTALDSDLAWIDTALLGSRIVAPAPTFGGSLVRPDVSRPIAREADASGRQSGVARPSAASASITAAVPPVGSVMTDLVSVIGSSLEQPFWETTVRLPGTGGKPARLALREYERYYTDRAVPERRAGAIRQRRVVEERLVYTSLFDL